MRASMIASGMLALMSLFAGPVASQTQTPIPGQAAPHPATQSTGAASGAGAAGKARGGVAAKPLDRVVSLDLVNVRLNDALKEINRQARLGLAYTPRVVPVDRKVSVRGRHMTAREALAAVLKGTGVKAVITATGSVALVKGKQGEEREAADSAEGVVIGRITDADTKAPLEGVTVTVKGTALSATTNAAGAYGMAKVPVGMRTLVVRFLGYQAVEQDVLVVEGKPVRGDIALRMGMSRLQEMVTTATGQQRRYELGNDITVIDVDSVMAIAPISNVTDLLEARVPGLLVQHTSGAPGDPSRLRLRGVSSVYGNNDPIVIVDGIRFYARQSDERSTNLAAGNFPGKSLKDASAIPAPSPLDQLDPNSIAKIEVLKGPSAATLYGQDAANGVIVITTKKGQPGPARWTISASRGFSEMPGRYPDALFRLGRPHGGGPLRLCPLTDFSCAADTLVRFQALNDPDMTVLGHGSSTQLSLGISGGTAALAYALTGSYSDEMGLLTLPDYEVERYGDLHGGQAPYAWMRRPQQLKQWSGTSRLSAKLGAHADASLTTTLTRQTQQRSDLERQLATLMSTYVDRETGAFYRANATNLVETPILVPDFYQQSTAQTTNFTNAVSVNWRPRGWLTTSADAGLNVIGRQDEVFRPRDVVDTLGALSTARGSSVVSTVNLRALAIAPIKWGFRLQVATGVNYTDNTVADLGTSVRGLARATSSLNGAGEHLRSSENRLDQASFGWYIEPSLQHKRFAVSTGLRFDGGSTFGSNVKLPPFPKLGGSWLISEESWFPFRRFFDVLRLRGAFGAAGVWPGPADRLRLYSRSRPWLQDGVVDATNVSTFGNTQLKPEKSVEFEGGFDTDLFDNRLSVGLTGYRKTRHDAIMNVPLAPSVYGGGSVLKNIGVVRNTGLELTITAQILRTDPITWSATTHFSRDRNTVVELGRGVEPFCSSGDAAAYCTGRVAPGYPLFGRWAPPILGYADINENGIIEASEVQLGDSMVFLGETVPKYQASLQTTLSLLRGRLSVSMGMAYQDGLTQLNQTAKTNALFTRGRMDPDAPFGEQAAVAVLGRTDYGIMQTVSTLRFNTLSVAFNASPGLTRRIGARSLSIAVQGRNLGLYTNYAGKDPNVNAYATGNGVADTGQLPMPRTWLLNVRVGY